MDNNHADNYVLVLEDRMEGKNEVEVGKLSVVSNIDDKGKLKTAPAEEAAIVFCEATYSSISRDIFSKTSDTFSGMSDSFWETSDLFSGMSDVFLNMSDIFSKTSDFFLEMSDFFLEMSDVFGGFARHSAEEKFEVRVGVCCG